MVPSDVKEAKRLHIGCGGKRIPGFVNVDVVAGSAVDVVADARALPFDQESVAEIYSCAVIEHFSRHEWVDVLHHWVSLLEPGGRIYISTADFHKAAAHYLAHGQIEPLLGLVVGGQRDRYDWHGMIFDERLLQEGLESAGIENIRRYDWRDHVVGRLGIDDYSQAYLPHMDKDYGELMMLNLCGTRRSPTVKR